MPLARGGRPLKRWTWVGVFGPEAILCAARVTVAGVPVAWWCVLDRVSGVAVEGRGGVSVSASSLRVRGRAELAFEVAGDPVEVVSPHDGSYAWTRKTPARASGWVAARGERRPLDAHAIVDESAGYHARRTAWRWSAGVGTTPSGAPVAWNLVAGMHDGDEASERTVWLDGAARAVAPATFGDDLGWAGGEPWRIACAREHVLRLRTNFVVARSDLEQRFGAVTGSLPFAGELAAAWGVMERHDVRW